MSKTLRFITFMLVIAISLVISPLLSAATTGFHLSHPVGLMHMLPVGEQPGWGTQSWFQFDLAASNVWNAPYEIYNNKNGKTLYYEADFEEYTSYFQFGQALSDEWAYQVQIPYVVRSGGALDGFIDNFHILIGSDRFSREVFDHNQNRFSIQVDGEEKLRAEQGGGVGNIKVGLKWWPIQNKGFVPGSCECGFGTQFQLKLPTQSFAAGITSGEIDVSGLLHWGIPIRNQSAVWMTAGFTYMQDNPFLKDFNFNNVQQMYEVSADFGLTEWWGFVFQLRIESPILNKNGLEPATTTGTIQDLVDRIASGWNSLVLWRGSQAIGFRYRANATWSTNFLFIEDWNFGQYDHRGDNLYVTNAPDVMFMLQTNVGF